MRLCGIGLGENWIFTQHDGFKELKPVQFFVRETNLHLAFWSKNPSPLHRAAPFWAPVPPPVFVTGPFPTHLADIPGPVWTILLWCVLSTYSVSSLGAAAEKDFWQQHVFIFLTQAKFRFVLLAPELGRRGSGQRFFLYNPSPNPLGNCKQPLLYILSQYCNPTTPLATIYCSLKCTLQHSGFGKRERGGNCNNFYNPRTKLDVTPTPPWGRFINTHRDGREGGWWTWVQI